MNESVLTFRPETCLVLWRRGLSGVKRVFLFEGSNPDTVISGFMAAFPSPPKSLLSALAALFAAVSIFYAAMWIFFGSRGVPVELGFDNKYLPAERSQLVQSVVFDSPAEHAGLKRGDRIVAIYGSPLQDESSLIRIWAQHKPGDAVQLTVVRPGNRSPIVLNATFRASGEARAEAGVAAHVGQGIVRVFPIVFLTVGLTLLFLRVDDRNAWLVALMFAGFVAVPAFSNSFLGVPSVVRPLATAYRAVFNNLVAALFYFFFATFPVRSPLDRRHPGLKWAVLVIGILIAAPALSSGDNSQSILVMKSQYGRLFILFFTYGLLVLGLISLIWNATSITSPEARRKVRVILWGTLVGVVPAMLALGASDFFGFHITILVGATVVAFLWLFPLSFAYAVVKHRVLEIPVLLQRSARYLLVQRGFLFLLVLLSVAVTTAFALLFARYLQSLTIAAVPFGIGLGTIFGSVLLWAGTRVHHDVGQRIDRAFFRSAYDTRVILEDLVDKTRTARHRTELAALLEHHLKEALQPNWLAVYLESSDNRLSTAAGDNITRSQVIPRDEPALEELARHGKPWDVTEKAPENLAGALFAPEHPPECLVPILGRDARLIGFIVLGARRSEEPYSAEDKRLLALVASQTAVALESIRLGEEIAERIEAERRTTQEMEFARQIQTKLFPQKLPSMRTLEYTGGCIPAKTVGGDYYDFLELRPGRLGIVLADIAGKGVPGALLMANLQANLRSQYAMAVDDLPRLLTSVNRLFFQNTDDASYATMFFADYNDATRLLRYSNCGHLPPLLIRAGGTRVERLHPTCVVLGMFEEWQSEVTDVMLARGDTLVLYTDGVTEAENRSGEEFGESRLVETLRDLSQLPIEQLKNEIVNTVRQFSGTEQGDDITLVVARCVA
jgi:phosphoserine phosphatase RsbU/P